MTDHIEPALTAEEWRDGEFDSHYVNTPTSLQIDHKGRVFATSDPDGDDRASVILNESHDFAALYKLIALANAALPDGDPRKITREIVDQLRSTRGEYLDFSAFGDALASYLPPE